MYVFFQKKHFFFILRTYIFFIKVRRPNTPDISKPVFVLGATHVNISCIESSDISCFHSVFAACQEAAKRGFLTVLVEAGPTLYNAMMNMDLIDEVHWYVSNEIGADKDLAWNPVKILPRCRETTLFGSTVKIVYTCK